ncbi:MAG: hypothetical protein LLG45_00440 [Actinomycetia bacterium]|nr:hypothetical protein [Actinomycetes bacterium]
MADRLRADRRVARRRDKPEIPWPRANRPVPDRRTIRSLEERAKELACLYRVDEALAREDTSVEETLAALIEAIPPGWQYPAACQVRITWEGRTFTSPGYVETEWRQTAPLRHGHSEVGRIEVSYTADMPAADSGPFLKEEVRLINAIAERIGTHLQQRRRRIDHAG